MTYILLVEEMLSFQRCDLQIQIKTDIIHCFTFAY